MGTERLRPYMEQREGPPSQHPAELSPDCGMMRNEMAYLKPLGFSDLQVGGGMEAGKWPLPFQRDGEGVPSSVKNNIIESRDLEGS